MLDFPGVDGIIPVVFNIVKDNRLGKYAISDQRYAEIREYLVSNGRGLFKTNSRYLEKMNWDDISVSNSEYHHTSTKIYDTVMKNRILLLSWDGEVYSRENGLVTYKIDVPENFFLGW